MAVELQPIDVYTTLPSSRDQQNPPPPPPPSPSHRLTGLVERNLEQERGSHKEGFVRCPTVGVLHCRLLACRTHTDTHTQSHKDTVRKGSCAVPLWVYYPAVY
jgi:hypothetical protein